MNRQWHYNYKSHLLTKCKQHNRHVCMLTQHHHLRDTQYAAAHQQYLTFPSLTVRPTIRQAGGTLYKWPDPWDTNSDSHICWFTASPHITTSASHGVPSHIINTPNFSHTSSSYGPNNSSALCFQTRAIYILVSCDRPRHTNAPQLRPLPLRVP